MREKSARQKDIDRYINFLKDIRSNSLGELEDYINIYPLRFYIKNHGVSNSIEFALKKLGVIRFDSEVTWTYEWGEPTKSHALQILDFLLAWRKKKEQQPTLNFGADFQTIVEHLLSISTDLKELLRPADLLISESDAMQELRNKIAASIAAGYYAHQNEDEQTYETINMFIINATDDLITKLYKK